MVSLPLQKVAGICKTLKETPQSVIRVVVESSVADKIKSTRRLSSIASLLCSSLERTLVGCTRMTNLSRS